MIQRRFRLRYAVVLVAISAVALLIWIVANSQVGYWVGRGELTIEFAIIDSESGSPIPDAEIHVMDLDRPPNWAGNLLFVLKADDHGIARTTQEARTVGADYELPFFTDTYAAVRPDWRIRVVAPDFIDGEIAYLPEQTPRTQRIAPAKYHLHVPIHLNKRPTSPEPRSGGSR